MKALKRRYIHVWLNFKTLLIVTPKNLLCTNNYKTIERHLHTSKILNKMFNNKWLKYHNPIVLHTKTITGCHGGLTFGIHHSTYMCNEVTAGTNSFQKEHHSNRHSYVWNSCDSVWGHCSLGQSFGGIFM